MPSLILTGHPCIGKTTFAQLLGTRALQHPSNLISRVIHIRECTARPDQTKAECYSSSHAEKATRAALKSEFDRGVVTSNGDGDDDGSSTLVILDSLNYIKGYRYELYCISKAAGQKHGVIWIVGSDSDGDAAKRTTALGNSSQPSDELAKTRNRRRRDLNDSSNPDGYYQDDETLDALVMRFEPPDAKNRWENPMYKVDMTDVLPWGKEGTLVEILPATDKPESQLTAIPTDDSDTKETSVNAPKSETQSASGFKRRSKKTTASQPQPTVVIQDRKYVTSSFPPQSQSTIPTSIASRNLTADVSNTTEQMKDPRKRKMEDVIDEILDSFLISTAPLREGMSTVKFVSAESNVLNEVDSLTQRINNEILKALKETITLSETSSTYYGKKITIENGGRHSTLTLSKPLHVNELRNCRKQFLRWISTHPMQSGTMNEDIVDVYISFIETNV